MRALVGLVCPFFAVLDIHNDWVGPCVVMQPMYEALTLLLDSWETRLLLLTVSGFVSEACRRPWLLEQDSHHGLHSFARFDTEAAGQQGHLDTRANGKVWS